MKIKIIVFILISFVLVFSTSTFYFDTKECALRIIVEDLNTQPIQVHFTCDSSLHFIEIKDLDSLYFDFNNKKAYIRYVPIDSIDLPPFTLIVNGEKGVLEVLDLRQAVKPGWDL